MITTLLVKSVKNARKAGYIRMDNKCLYLIGSLRNERIPILANKIRKDNPDFEVFDDWYSAGPEADDCWKTHQKTKGLSYQEALGGMPQGMSLVLIRNTLIDPLTLCLFYRLASPDTWKSCTPPMGSEQRQLFFWMKKTSVGT